MTNKTHSKEKSIAKSDQIRSFVKKTCNIFEAFVKFNQEILVKINQTKTLADVILKDLDEETNEDNENAVSPEVARKKLLELMNSDSLNIEASFSTALEDFVDNINSSFNESQSDLNQEDENNTLNDDGYKSLNNSACQTRNSTSKITISKIQSPSQCVDTNTFVESYALDDSFDLPDLDALSPLANKPLMKECRVVVEQLDINNLSSCNRSFSTTQINSNTEDSESDIEPAKINKKNSNLHKKFVYRTDSSDSDDDMIYTNRLREIKNNKSTPQLTMTDVCNRFISNRSHDEDQSPKKTVIQFNISLSNVLPNFNNFA